MWHKQCNVVEFGYLKFFFIFCCMENTFCIRFSTVFAAYKILVKINIMGKHILAYYIWHRYSLTVLKCRWQFIDHSFISLFEKLKKKLFNTKHVCYSWYARWTIYIHLMFFFLSLKVIFWWIKQNLWFIVATLTFLHKSRTNGVWRDFNKKLTRTIESIV